MARFRIKRQRPYNAADRSPWKVKDAERPHYLGHYATFELALASCEAILHRERDQRTRGAISRFFPRDFDDLDTPLEVTA